MAVRVQPVPPNAQRVRAADPVAFPAKKDISAPAAPNPMEQDSAHRVRSDAGHVWPAVHAQCAQTDITYRKRPVLRALKMPYVTVQKQLPVMQDSHSLAASALNQKSPPVRHG